MVGFPPSARRLLPDWVGFEDLLEDVPNGSVILWDETHISLHARGAMTKAGRNIGTFINLSRQRTQTLIIIVQEARQLDVNAVSQADVIIIKEMTEISRNFERKELRALTEKARVALKTVHNRKSWAWVHSEPGDFEGLIENITASFWKPAISAA